MPTYEYECDKCRRVFELWQRISDAPLSTCEACGGSVRRLLSPAPFILKGGGWYVTDYPSESRKKAIQSEKAPSSSGEKSSTSTPSSTTAETKTSTDSGGSSSPGPAKAPSD
ncbi:MAG TPA: FmdB family zinc ribbon protein [Methylomirabilota bacterium]